MKKIVFCGGHHNSALLVAKTLKEKGWDIFWFGHQFSMVGDKNFSAEYIEVKDNGIPFIEIKAGKWQPKYKFLLYVFRIPYGFFQSMFWLIKIRPCLIVSFGGYLALPVSVCGWLLGIPIVTHEQTTVLGIANGLIAKIARKVLVSFPFSTDRFPKEKVILTGLPIRTELFAKGRKLFNNSKKTVYVTGGKQGAHLINRELFKILPELLKKFNVIHQCGSTSIFDDIKTAQKIKGKFDSSVNYFVKEYFFEDEIGAVFKSADFVISRAGAHTIYELMYLVKPAILIPIPWSSKDEQMHNAQMLQEMGLAEILEQKDLEKGKLLQTIMAFDHNLEKYKLNSDSFLVIENAKERIVKEIETLLS